MPSTINRRATVVGVESSSSAMSLSCANSSSGIRTLKLAAFGVFVVTVMMGLL